MRNEIIDLTEPEAVGEEQEHVVSAHRPSSFDDFIGQDDIVSHLSIMIDAAHLRHRHRGRDI